MLVKNRQKIYAVIIAVVLMVVVFGVVNTGNVAGAATYTSYADWYKANQGVGQDARWVEFRKFNPKGTQAQMLAQEQTALGMSGTPAQKAVAEESKNQPAPTYTIIGNIMGWIFYYLAAGLGYVIDKVLALMVAVGRFNQILSMPAVQAGWVIVRDICNNFFIIILLVIAVGTILRVPVYSEWKRLLPKLLIMAVLINFSKLFAGLLIDFSQIVMLQFAYKIVEAGGHNIILGSMGFPSFFEITKEDLQAAASSPGVSVISLLASLLIALVVGAVAIVVILIITVILIYRIIMFWFLVILSPLAFLASTLPRTQAYSKRWWDELFKYLMVGPLMMFFLYLSISTMMTMDNLVKDQSLKPENTTAAATGTTGANTLTLSEGQKTIDLGQITTTQGLFRAIVVIGLLVGSLAVAQEVGVAGASWAGKGMGLLKKMGKGTLKLGGGAALGAGKKAWGLAKGADALTGGKVGKAINAVRGPRGAVTGAAAGAALGTLVAPGLGTAVGAGVGALTGGFAGKWLARHLKTKRNMNANRIKAQAGGDKGEFLDETRKTLDFTEENGKIIYTKDQLDESGKKIDGKGKSDEVTDKNDLKKIKYQHNGERGVYEQMELDDHNELIKAKAKILRDDSGRKINLKLTEPGGGLWLDENQKGTTDETKAKYRYNEAEGVYEEVFYDKFAKELTDIEKTNTLLDEQGNIFHRWSEWKDEQGIVYRRQGKKDKDNKADTTYYKTGGRGEFVNKAGENIETATDKKLVAAKGSFGGTVREISKPWARAVTGYLAATNKGVVAREAVEDEKIKKIQKNYAGMSDQALNQLLDTEGDGNRRMAIAMTLAIKNGFKDVAAKVKGKEALAGNNLLLKEFDESMNKRNLVMNNTRADGTIDEGEIAKQISSGGARWSEQDTKNMDNRAFEAMARNQGVNFYKALESMNRGTLDLENIKKGLRTNLDSRSFAGEDLEIRKAYGAMANDFVRAFSKDGQLNTDRLEEALSKISKADVFDKVGQADMNDQRFQKAFARAMDINMIKKMSNSRDISPEKFERFLDMIRDNRAEPKVRVLWNKLQKTTILGGGADLGGTTEEVIE